MSLVPLPSDLMLKAKQKTELSSKEIVEMLLQAEIPYVAMPDGDVNYYDNLTIQKDTFRHQLFIYYNCDKSIWTIDISFFDLL